MDFSKIIKKAWEFSWTAKSLWWLGFFAVITEAGLESSTFYQLPAIPTNEDTAKAFAENISAELLSLFSDVGFLSAFIAIATILTIVVLYVSYRAKAGLILFANQADQTGVKKNESAKKFFALGQKFPWSLLIFNIFLTLIALAFVTLILAPFVPFLTKSDDPLSLILISGLTIIAIGILVIFSIGLTIIKQFGERLIVLDSLAAGKALVKASKMAYKKLFSSAIVWLIALAIQISFTVASVIAFFLIGLLFFVLGMLFYFLLNNIGITIITIVGSVVTVALLLVLISAFTAFVSYYWTLCYKELRGDK